ncbi:ECF-type sigma factor negative effector [Bacillus cereus Rock3-28]|nr:ECF-type sigma factor negative effector [Bacillus cereus Rock3-28]
MNRGGSKRKKHLIAGVLAAALLIPTTGFAYQSIMADGIYGSFEN